MRESVYVKGQCWESESLTVEDTDATETDINTNETSKGLGERIAALNGEALVALVDGGAGLNVVDWDRRSRNGEGEDGDDAGELHFDFLVVGKM